jgi:hypothetical protein
MVAKAVNLVSIRKKFSNTIVKAIPIPTFFREVIQD